MAEGGTGEPPKFSLVTSTHPLRHKLLRAREQGNFADFWIEVNDIRIPCHKLILSAQSEYFSCMLQHENTVEVAQGFVNLKLLDADAVKLIVDFMYSGKIELEFHMVQEVIKVMDRFQLTENTLREKASDYITPHLCTDNCLGWFKFGDQLDFENIKTEAQSIMIQRFSDVCKSSEFVSLSFSELTDYMQKVIQSHFNHDQCLKAFVTWAIHDPSKRCEKFDEILQIVSLNKCSTRVLKNVYEEHGKVLLNNFDLLHQFTAALSHAIPDPSGSTLDIIVAGGCTDPTVYNRKTWLLNLESGRSIERASQTKGVYGAAICASLDGFISAGGSPTLLTNDATADCVLYHKNTDTCIDLPSLQAPTICSGATCVQGAMLMVIGGYMDRKNKAVCLDLRTRKWTICDDMPQGMVCPIVGSIDKCVFVIFSTCHNNEDARNGTEILISVQCYDTTTSAWTFKSPLPDGIKTTEGARAVTIADLLCLVGGEGAICATYDPTSDNWTVLTPPRNVHAYGAALTINGKIILSGGRRDGKPSDSIEEYDPSTNMWRLLPVKLPTGLYGHCMMLG